MEEKKQLALLGTVCALIVIVGFWVHSMLQERRAWTEEQRLQITKEVDAVELFVRTRASRPNWEAETAAREKRILRTLPESMDQGGFLTAIQRKAVIAGLTIEKVTPGSQQNESGLLTLPVSLVCKGNYFQLVSFFRQIEERGRYVKIREVRIESAEAGMLRCHLEMQIFAFAAA